MTSKLDQEFIRLNPEEIPVFVKKLSPLQKIRLKCVECCGFNPNEVKLCQSQICPLYSCRTGHNLSKKRELSQETLENCKKIIIRARNMRNYPTDKNSGKFSSEISKKNGVKNANEY